MEAAAWGKNHRDRYISPYNRDFRQPKKKRPKKEEIGHLVGLGIADEEDLQAVGEDDPPVLPLVAAGLQDLHFRSSQRHIWARDGYLLPIAVESSEEIGEEDVVFDPRDC